MDGRPSRGNKAAFLNFSGTMWTRLNNVECTEIKLKICKTSVLRHSLKVSNKVNSNGPITLGLALINFRMLRLYGATWLALVVGKLPRPVWQVLTVATH